MSKSWKKLANGHPVIPFLLFVLICAPLKLGVGNIALMLLGGATLWQFRLHRHFSNDRRLLLPMVLFVLMAVSLIWSIDISRSLKALPRMIYLLVIPLCFFMIAPISDGQRKKLLQNFAYGMTAICIFYILKATLRFIETGNTGVFFYHELVTEETNAIYVSTFLTIAFFALLAKSGKSLLDKCCCFILGMLIVMLSSKNVVAIWLLLNLLYLLFFSGVTRKRILLGILTFVLLSIISMLLFPKIIQRFQAEFDTTSARPKPIEIAGRMVDNVSIEQAWNQERFTANHHFAGAAFRVYQFRIFTELLREEPIFWTGYGLNASFKKVGEKADEHGLYKGDGDKLKGYQGKNFHNQYVQNFAELGIFGFLLLVAMLALTLKNGIRKKDFTHISFAVLMISLFLTESFLWRQRGVTFFVVMYCLFNSGMAVLSATKNE